MIIKYSGNNWISNTMILYFDATFKWLGTFSWQIVITQFKQPLGKIQLLHGVKQTFITLYLFYFLGPVY